MAACTVVLYDNKNLEIQEEILEELACLHFMFLLNVCTNLSAYPFVAG